MGRLITTSTSKQAESLTDEIKHHNRKEDTKSGFRWCNIRTGDSPRIEQTPDIGEKANENGKSVICHRNTPLQERDSIKNSANQLDNEKEHQDGERSNNDHTNPDREKATKRSYTIDKRHLEPPPEFKNRKDNTKIDGYTNQSQIRLRKPGIDIQHGRIKPNQGINHPCSPPQAKNNDQK